MLGVTDLDFSSPFLIGAEATAGARVRVIVNAVEGRVHGLLGEKSLRRPPLSGSSLLFHHLSCSPFTTSKTGMHIKSSCFSTFINRCKTS